MESASSSKAEEFKQVLGEWREGHARVAAAIRLMVWHHKRPHIQERHQEDTDLVTGVEGPSAHFVGKG